MHLKYIIPLLVLIFIPQIVDSQLNKGRVQTKQYCEEIPFEYIREKIIIKATVNGKKGRYIFDTGAPCIVFKDSINKSSFSLLQSIYVRDANHNRQKTDLVNLDQVRIGNITYANIPAIYADPFPMPFTCFDVDGYIGSNLVRFGAFKVDWEKQVLIIANSYKAFDLSKKEGVKLHINKVQSSPFVDVQLDRDLTTSTLIDTGSDDFYSLSNSHLEYFHSKGFMKNSIRYQSSGNSSHGMAGVDTSVKGTNIVNLTQFKINNSTYNDVVIRTTNASSRIGMELLSKGDFVLDYKRKRFFFSQRSSDVTWKEKSFGVDMVLIDDTFRVGGVWKGTLADSAGIKTGDIIVDFDNFGLNRKPRCEAFFELGKYTKQKQTITLYYRKKEDTIVHQIELDRVKY